MVDRLCHQTTGPVEKVDLPTTCRMASYRHAQPVVEAADFFNRPRRVGFCGRNCTRKPMCGECCRTPIVLQQIPALGGVLKESPRSINSGLRERAPKE